MSARQTRFAVAEGVVDWNCVAVHAAAQGAHMAALVVVEKLPVAQGAQTRLVVAVAAVMTNWPAVQSEMAAQMRSVVAVGATD